MSGLSCRDAVELAAGLADARIGDAMVAVLEEHARHCEGCRR
jgi:hypothetical protein